LCWDEEILKRLDIPAGMLPEVRDSSGVFGYTAPGLFDGTEERKAGENSGGAGGGGIPVAGIAGDQQAALFGQTCFTEGMAKNTFGTGGFLLVNTGERIVPSEHGLLNTIAWGLNGKVTYAMEGSVFVSGATMQWLRDGIHLIDDVGRSAAICRSMESTDGVYLVPAFAGLGAPYWDPYARGALLGLTRGTSREQIIRAGVESMVYQTVDLMDAMSRDVGQPLRSLRVDGGAAGNDFLLQFTADMLGREVIRPACIETTSLGAAYLAGLAVGYWKNPEDVDDGWQADRRFAPAMDAGRRKKLLAGWHRAVERSLGWAAE
ncbi:MAG: FGGY-family carbohydrate kinase, partial [Bacillota bacterium]|nr:FGGY-family carbohydrate kinase [Bacillota bacterium]